MDFYNNAPLKSHYLALMIITTIFVYSNCLKGINEKEITPETLSKFKSYCDIIIKNNPLASFEDLCDICSIVLKFILESPGTSLPIMKYFI